tara:strand:- start:1962 stop:2177 length:216 start_codon:yes stop_codon:yes gene_type:complete
MELIKGLKFIQDNSLHCEVLELYSASKKTTKRILKFEMVRIKKNDNIFNYDLESFQKSFTKGLIFGSFKLK